MDETRLQLLTVVLACGTVAFMSTQMVSCEKLRLQENTKQYQIREAYRMYQSVETTDVITPRVR